MLTIRPLLALEEMADAVLLQQSYWGDDAESVVPAHMLLSLARHGGHVLAAFEDEAMAGVLIGFLGTAPESQGPAAPNLQVISKRMVVLPQFRSGGIGYRLKMAQRDFAIQQGIEVVSWTFDPMMSPNAHLNIRKLGAWCPKFRQNYYGTSGIGGLATQGTSDRLFVEWRVMERRVEDRARGQVTVSCLEDYLKAGAVLVNPAQFQDSMPCPIKETKDATGELLLLEIPRDYRRILSNDAALAQAWQMQIREQLQKLLAADYYISDFVGAVYEGHDRVFYVLER